MLVLLLNIIQVKEVSRFLAWPSESELAMFPKSTTLAISNNMNNDNAVKQIEPSTPINENVLARVLVGPFKTMQISHLF